MRFRVFMLKIVMVTHVLRFLARRSDKRGTIFFYFLSTRFDGKCKDTELTLSFFKNSILVKETHFPFILVE